MISTLPYQQELAWHFVSSLPATVRSLTHSERDAIRRARAIRSCPVQRAYYRIHFDMLHRMREE